VLLVEPKEKDAETFSKKRLKPMLECCPILRDVMLEDTSKDGTILSKDFPGGNFTAVSALVPVIWLAEAFDICFVMKPISTPGLRIRECIKFRKYPVAVPARAARGRDDRSRVAQRTHCGTTSRSRSFF
jgi:hypothetical protein